MNELIRRNSLGKTAIALGSFAALQRVSAAGLRLQLPDSGGLVDRQESPRLRCECLSTRVRQK